MAIQRNGELLQADFFENMGGLNTSSSPFTVKDEEATGGSNYNYSRTGGITTRKGHDTVNSSANSQTLSRGLSQHVTTSGTKTVIRAATLAIQSVNIDAATFTALTEDTTTAASTIFSSSSAQPVVFSQFNTANGNTLWAAGGGSTNIYGITSATKTTKNGIVAPTGSFTATPASLGSGVWAATGTYFYAVAYRKGSTLVTSNAALDVSANVSVVTDKVTINLSGLSNLDTTQVDKVYLVRSAVSGVTAFTTGDLVAQISSGTTTYDDTGTYISTSQNISRSGNTILDNTQLTDGTYNVITTWKRRLVTATGSTLYFSDLNKPESWPTANTITVPSGGPVTALAVISFSTPYGNDEYLAVFKERELWIVTGTSSDDWALKYIDQVGCPNQPLVVIANGYLFWIDYRGVYLWDGSGKPSYMSRPIENLFDLDGDIDKSNLGLGCGYFVRKNHEVIWNISSKIYGTQKFCIKMDLRLTLPRTSGALDGRTIDGCFLFDTPSFPIYACASFLPSTVTEELAVVGDNTGKLYKAYTVWADGGSAYSFNYQTRYIHGGNPNINKNWKYVIVWVDQVGSWPLYLDYWSGYKGESTTSSTLASTITTAQTNASSLWDVGNWDVAYWDGYNSRGVPLVFNLSAGKNNSMEGSAIKLQFRQDTANEPITINGFSVLYSEKGMVRDRSPN